MFVALQVFTIVLVTIATALALAHALEWPGKLRLTKEQYFAIQPIYYPGFTIGGAAEPSGLLLVAVLLYVMPTGTLAHWLTAAAFVALLAMHATYWILTHPVNNFWLKDTKLLRAGASFFKLGASRAPDAREDVDWTALRDRWEFSHVVRAGLGMVSLVLLVTAVAL
ncbi:DUF1772 domain-containing protein [Sinorhizobium numidicum]|uniref:DUF1772 domain-containing protein n=1 Tax=Sinorhizobium numidicum TaxID=680248 RepID=A0ABY8CU52_9HYPH|nr:DUF1772 domain-containing protein [Sinorhizobium numidicum]WEX75435.1 DUF1772 domain-containing protein [Sinorhizobium numidicum]WEX81432.1 DUF1772 domain-containing protein [Sinorhizobium numidicum]